MVWHLKFACMGASVGVWGWSAYVGCCVYGCVYTRVGWGACVGGCVYG